MSSQRSLVQELSTLRAVVGPEAKEGDLLRLLEKHNGDVQRAIAEFFDGPQDHATPPPTAVARAADQALYQVVTPQGMRPGQQLQVHTPSGIMRVTIPEGVAAGQVFLVRCPPQAGPGYPGLQQPSVVVQQRPAVHVVHSHPYYGRPYGYRRGSRYCNDGVGVGVGLLGGLLIADALFW